MSRTSRLAALAAVAAVSVAAAPAQGRISAAERSQNSGIHRAAVNATGAGRNANRALRASATLTAAIATLRTSVNALTGGAPALVAGLTAANTAIGNLAGGLSALSTGVTTLAGAVNSPATGLPALNTKVNTPPEIGVTSLFVTPYSAADQPGTTTNHITDIFTGQIPHDGVDAAQASGTTLIPCGSASGCDFGVEGALHTSRPASAVASGKEAGQAGAVMTITGTGASGTTAGLTYAGAQTTGTSAHTTLSTGQAVLLTPVEQVAQTSPAPGDDTGTTLPFRAAPSGFYAGGAAPITPASPAVANGAVVGEIHVGPGLYNVSLAAQYFDLDNPS